MNKWIIRSVVVLCFLGGIALVFACMYFDATQPKYSPSHTTRASEIQETTLDMVLVGETVIDGGYYPFDDYRLAVFHDNERNVTCYTYDRGYGGGISCFTDEELSKSEEG